jgi:putative transposase
MISLQRSLPETLNILVRLPKPTTVRFLGLGNDDRDLQRMDQGAELLFIQSARPNQNTFVERFDRSFRDEVLDANLFNLTEGAQEAADAWVVDYNEFRAHDYPGDITPMEFMQRTFKTAASSFEKYT